MQSVAFSMNSCQQFEGYQSAGDAKLQSSSNKGHALNPARPGPVALKPARPGLKTDPARKTCLGRDQCAAPAGWQGDLTKNSTVYTLLPYIFNFVGV